MELSKEDRELIAQYDKILTDKYDLSIWKGSVYNPLPLKEEVLDISDYRSGGFEHSVSDWDYTEEEKEYVASVVGEYLEKTLTNSQLEWYNAYYYADLDAYETISHGKVAEELGIKAPASRKRKERSLKRIKMSQV